MLDLNFAAQQLYMPLWKRLVWSMTMPYPAQATNEFRISRNNTTIAGWAKEERGAHPTDHYSTTSI